VSGPVTSVARVEDVQIFLKDPIYIIFPVPSTQTLFRFTVVTNSHITRCQMAVMGKLAWLKNTLEADFRATCHCSRRQT